MGKQKSLFLDDELKDNSFGIDKTVRSKLKIHTLIR
jgi:hypothetical protein